MNKKNYRHKVHHAVTFYTWYSIKINRMQQRQIDFVGGCQFELEK